MTVVSFVRFVDRPRCCATARTGQLQSKTYEATTLSGATILLDFHASGYPAAREPHRSELTVTAAISLMNAVFEMGQQFGLVTNARDAADRVVFMDEGQIVEQGHPDAVLLNPGHPHTKLFLSRFNQAG